MQGTSLLQNCCPRSSRTVVHGAADTVTHTPTPSLCGAASALRHTQSLAAHALLPTIQVLIVSVLNNPRYWPCLLCTKCLDTRARAKAVVDKRAGHRCSPPLIPRLAPRGQVCYKVRLGQRLGRLHHSTGSTHRPPCAHCGSTPLPLQRRLRSWVAGQRWRACKVAGHRRERMRCRGSPRPTSVAPGCANRDDCTPW